MIRTFVAILLFVPHILWAIEPPVFLSIGLESFGKVESLDIRVYTGKYSLWDKDKQVLSGIGTSAYAVRCENNLVVLLKNGEVKGSYSSLNFKGEGYRNSLCLKSQRQKRYYDDGIEIIVVDGSLQIVNRVSFENYVAGVVESEVGGSTGNLEFLKVQAIISRTYALRNLLKHKENGYNLCDGVHCQVYKGKAVTTEVLMACSRSAGEVILDESGEPILAAFHSNSGGYTVNSEDAWSSALPYLRGVKDTFSVGMPHYSWEYEISKNEFLHHLALEYKVDTLDKALVDSLFVFRQDSLRMLYLCPGVLLKELRISLSLRSTYFDVHDKGNGLLFVGRGYGHGVGMSQEGAIRMADNGYNAHKIIQHYYKGVAISRLEITD